jgi:hypothetical protein
MAIVRWRLFKVILSGLQEEVASTLTGVQPADDENPRMRRGKLPACPSTSQLEESGNMPTRFLRSKRINFPEQLAWNLDLEIY